MVPAVMIVSVLVAVGSIGLFYAVLISRQARALSARLRDVRRELESPVREVLSEAERVAGRLTGPGRRRWA